MSKQAHKLVKTLLRNMQPGDTAVVALAADAHMSRSKVHDETTPDPTSNDDDQREKSHKRSDNSANVNEPLYVRIVRKGSDGDGADDLAVPMALLFSSLRGNIGMPGLSTVPTAPKSPTADKQPDPCTGEYPTDDHGMQTFDPPGQRRRYHNCG